MTDRWEIEYMDNCLIERDDDGWMNRQMDGQIDKWIIDKGIRLVERETSFKGYELLTVLYLCPTFSSTNSQ